MGVFILRRKMPHAHRPYKVWGYPVVPAIFIAFCGYLFFNTIITRPREAAIGLSLILTGIPVYLFMQWKHSRNKVEDITNGNIDNEEELESDNI